MKRVIAAFTILYFSLASYAKIKVLSPAAGVWGNRQVLLIEREGNESNSEVFYSLDGSDPALSGFVYDGPVLLDKGGNVTLNVSSGEEKYTIAYTVTEPEINEPFLKNAARSLFIDCIAGDVLTLPRSIRYSMDGLSFERGRDLSCPKDNILYRVHPIIIDDGRGNFYSFLLRIMPKAQDTGGEASVPFSVRGWNKVRLNDEKSIYSIDGGMWLPCTGAGEPVTLDRKVSHTIYWQSVAYKKSNPIKSFTLPPMPRLDSSIGEAGEVAITVQGDSGYSIGVMAEGELSFMRSAKLDTVYGDEVSGNFCTKMYYNNVYQGSICLPYSIDRLRPPPPIITSSIASSSSAFLSDVLPPSPSPQSKAEGVQKTTVFSRKDVAVCVTGTEGTRLFVSVDGGDYKESGGGVEYTVGIGLGDGGFPVAQHKVIAYCVDSKGNKSDSTEYNVLIDKYNYFVDEESGKKGALGREEDAFSSLEECLSYLEGSAHITLRGTVHTSLSSQIAIKDCVIEGEGDDARLIIGGGTIAVGGKSALKNLILERGEEKGGKDNGTSSTPLIVSEKAVLDIEGCEVFALYGDNGNVIEVKGGELTIQNSGITGKAKSFVVAVQTEDAKVSIQNSRISATAMEGVCVSSQGGETAVKSSVLKNSGMRAHAVELFNAKGHITDNAIEADLSLSGSLAIYEKNSAVEKGENEERGWQ